MRKPLPVMALPPQMRLTTQVPTRHVYLTSGRNRRLHLGAQVVEMKHAPRWMLLLSHRAAGEAVRALAWIGRQGASKALKTLKHRLSPSTIEELVAVRPALPSWMLKSISRTLASHAYLTLSRDARLEEHGVGSGPVPRVKAEMAGT